MFMKKEVGGFCSWSIKNEKKIEITEKVISDNFIVTDAIASDVHT